MTLSPAPKRTNALILILAALGLLTLVCVAVFVGLVALGRNAPPRSGAYTVEYRVGGSTSGASITYQNANGGTEQNDVGVPWSQPVSPARRGQFVYLAAQNKSAVGDVTCQIVVNGAVWKESRSGADYGIATCSGALP